MEEKESFYAAVDQICAQDTRYKPDAYEFILQALHFTQNKLKKEGHVSGLELSQGIRDFVVEQYGPMAKTVLNHWGITKTEDFGNIVFNLIDKKLLSKDENDSLEDFKSIYDFDAAFANILSDLVKNIE